MKKMMPRYALAIIFLLTSLIPSYAYDGAHYDPDKGTTCATCHTTHMSQGSSGYSNLCISCHSPGNTTAGMKPLAVGDAANPFKTYTASGINNMNHTSHRWSGSDTVPAAGALPPIQAAMTSITRRMDNELSCVRCHNQHTEQNAPYLRMSNDGDRLCLDCHRSRNVTNHQSGSHPVNINYTQAATGKPGSFNIPPINSNPNNATSDLGARLSQSNNTLLCSTCHGVHYTDSKSSTVDSSTTFAQLSSNDGYLLRTDLRGAKATTPGADNPNICTNCHAGKKSHNANGQDVQCADCHGAHVEFDPNDPTGSKGTNSYLVRRNMTVNGSSKPVYFTFTGSAIIYNKGDGSGLCETCHSVPSPGGKYPAAHALSLKTDCVGCHSHDHQKSSFTANVTCSNCHGYPPTSGSHTPHLLVMGCALCHPVPDATDSSKHINKTVDFVQTINYTTATNSCSNLYCHSDGTTLSGTFTPAVAPLWGKTTLGCTGCHGGTTTGPAYGNGTPKANSHAAHVVGMGIGCAVCHSSVVNQAGKIISGSPHVNKIYDVSGTTFTLANTPSATVPAQCSNISCHSGKAAVWGSTLTCGSCHADQSSTAATGSHKLHVSDDGIACTSCHNGSGSGTALHANGTLNLSFNGATATYSKGSTFASGQPYGSCATVSCHGSQSTDLLWGSTDTGCQACHTGTIDTDVFTLPFNAKSPVAVISATEWLSSGHGRVSGSYPSGNPAAALSGTNQCNYCHDSGSKHNSSANQFRLKNFSTASFGRNAPCLICHGAGATGELGKTATITVTSRHFGADHGGSSGGGYFCWDCHDPHGDGNIFMIHDKVAKTSDRTSGAPLLTTGTTFTATGTGTDYVGSSGICQVCHTSTAHYTATSTGDAHNSDHRCTTCHNHSGSDGGSAFSASGGQCDACHGYPPAARAVTVSFGTTGNWNNARFEDYSGGGGAHLLAAHIPQTAKASEGWRNCTLCHNGGSKNPSNNHKMLLPVASHRSNVTINVDPAIRFANTFIIYTGAKLVDQSSAAKTGSCFNIACHMSPSPRWSSEK